ncbi:hypothetical protein MLD38_008523 [Melastoma candidum]|uniref:Uncharacterized protein n=1 Tax=Melastoma candidum TaxID=119954 RepID=A0ACB9RU84_9MYRT|nr:hypothetical protein MLD38_008523 [Melastoma candidum]
MKSLSTFTTSFVFLAFLALPLPPLTTPVNARLFPNVSAIPPSLAANIRSAGWDAFRGFAGCHPGEARPGLSKLKQYFHYFGYMQSSSSLGNFTDDYDDSLADAIRTYQKNFNLNVTGDLDSATLSHLVMPRCGNPDIVNGTTSMNSGKASAPVGSRLHAVGHYSFFPGTPRWPSGQLDLTYAFLPGNNLDAKTRQVFARAFQRWSEVTPLTFNETSNYRRANIRIGFYTGDHGDGEPFDGVMGTLAHAFSPPNGLFHLDGAENWVVGGDVTTASSDSDAIDLESVAVHEIGHLLGLGHSSVEESIMYPTISSRTRKVQLTSDDVSGIQVLYGSNPNSNASEATTSTQDRETSGSSTRVGNDLVGAILAVGFLSAFL